MSQEGLILFRQRDFKAAIAKFEEAYSLEKEPNLLYNVARSYDELGDTASAVRSYELFLAQPGVDPKARERAEDRLRVLKAPPSADARLAEPSSVSPPPPREEGTRFGPLPWVTLVGGAVVAAAGTALFVVGEGNHSTVVSDPGYGKADGAAELEASRARDLIRDGNTAKTLGFVGWGVGGAALATSAVLFWLRRTEPHAESPASVATEFLPGGAHVLLRGRF